MIKQFLVFIALFIGLAATELRAQCPEPGAVQTALDASDLEVFYPVIDQLRSCPDQRDSLALVLHRLGILHYSDSALDSAIFYTTEALNVWEKLPTQLGTGKSAFNLGYFLKSKGAYRQSIPYLERSVAVYDELQEHARLRGSYGQLCDAYARVGAYQKAHAVIALAILYDEREERRESLAGAYLTKGVLHLKQGQYRAAADVLEQADAIYKEFPVSVNTANTIYNLAWASDELGDKQQAEREYLRALQLYRALQECKDVANACNSLGVFYVENDKLIKALPLLQEGLQTSRDCDLLVNEAQSQDHFGEYYLKTGQIPEAIAAYQRAQQLLLPVFQPNNLSDVPEAAYLDRTSNQIDLFIYLSDQARALDLCLDDQGCDVSVEKALQVYRRADQLIDFIRRTHINADTKLFWRQQVLRFYERAVAFCHRAGEPEAAFYFFEKSKAILLLEALLDNDALSVVPDSLRQVEYELTARLNDLQDQLQNDQAEESELYKELLEQQRALEVFREQLRIDYPSYREMTQELQIPTPETFYAECLQTRQATMVHFLWGEERVYAFTLAQRGIQTYDLGSSSDLQLSTQAVLGYFSEGGLIEAAPAAFAQDAFALYQQLFASLSLAPGQNLVLVPDGPLTYLPFSALLTEQSGSSTALSTFPYLIRQYSINYAYSAGVFLRQSQAKQRKAAIITAFAPFAGGRALVDYPALDYSNDELSRISEVLRCTVLKNEAASLENWKKQAAKASILHLSTHAFSSPMEQAPHIAFYDSLLYLRDVYQLSIPAQLVVLSACQTQIGRIAPGEGILGLGRAFVQAGAGSVVSSLWNVNAKSTGQILASFYAELANGTPKPEALHRAKLAFLEDPAIPTFQKSPYYWAGLSFYGNPDPVQLQKKSWWSFGGLLIAGLLAVVAGLWWRCRQ